MTTTERSHEVKRPTLVRPALRVQAPDGVEWQVEHRISPWRRRIQPIAFVWFMPRRYSEVTPKRPAPRPPSDEDEKTQEIRRPRKNRLEKLPAWLAYITIVLIAVLEMLYGMFVLALMVVDIAARLAVALILSVFLGIEVLAQWIVGSISRLSPKKRGRVDVLRTLPENECIAAQTVVTTQSEADARQLVQALAAHLQQHSPVELSDDPEAQSLIIGHHGHITDVKTVHLGGGAENLTIADRLDPDGSARADVWRRLFR